MPSLPADTLVNPADSLTAVPDTAEAYYAPQYVDGFPVLPAGDTVLTDINTLPVIEAPVPAQAQPFARSPLHDTPCMVLLLLGVLTVVVSYRTGYKYFENIWHNMFSTRRRENLFEDHTVNETQVLAALIANTCIVQGFLLYHAVQWWRPALAGAMHSHVFLYVGVFCLLVLAFYVAQWVTYKVLGFVFSDQVGSKLLLDGFKATQSVMGLVLLPVLVLVMLYPAHTPWLLGVAALCYLVARIIFIYKGFRIFYSNLSSFLYFILYLCAVEIVPLTILAYVTLWICDTLQS